MLNYKIFRCNPLQENAAVLWDDSLQGALLDPGCLGRREVDEITQFIDSKGIKPQLILLTHAHFDHIYGVAPLAAKYGIGVYMHPSDKVILSRQQLFAAAFGLPAPDSDFRTIDIHEGNIVSFGSIIFTVIETPGHTPGGVCYYSKESQMLLSGDTLFAGSIGRTDHPGGDYDKEIVSIMDKLMGLDGDTVVLPGHGPTTDIGYERTHNPFLQPFNEPWEFEENGGE